MHWDIIIMTLEGGVYNHDYYGWPFLSIPRTLTATSNFEVDVSFRSRLLRKSRTPYQM